LLNCTPDLQAQATREKILINEGWTFKKYSKQEAADSLIYDIRPEVTDTRDDKAADSKPTEAVELKTKREILKPWILPTANAFIKDATKRHARPAGNPGQNFPFVQNSYDDSAWEKLNLPHDWGIKGPFLEGPRAEVGGGMGRLASHGVAWYRKKLAISKTDAGKSIFLQVDGAMSYAMVWLNGQLVGGWPYGYNSWQLDLTPYLKTGADNQLAIRIDNPPLSARWYPGGGLYRNVWLIKTNPVHVGQWGTFVTTKNVSKTSATIDIAVNIDNQSPSSQNANIITHLYALDAQLKTVGKAVASFPAKRASLTAGGNTRIESSLLLKNPKLWGPPPTQQPNLYKAVTQVWVSGKMVDQYETRFGIRSVVFAPNKGILVNGERIQIKGVNQHHDLGALGAAFNTRAAERQLEILHEMGCNAVRMSHNPPAPELLELTDRMGFLVMNEVFDSWERKKTPLDFHLIFPDWHEADARSIIRRDRNCPSVIIWSFGNEVGEQYTAEEGAAIGKRLHDIMQEEDPTRPSTAAMNYAKADMPFPTSLDLISLNYQGEGIRQSPEFEGTDRIRTPPSYGVFHQKFPDKVVLSTETASAFSSRGIYLFPVTKDISSPVRDGRGGDSKIAQVSSYELYAVDFGSSVDKVFAAVEQHPFVAGEFVWTGWDYIGEPTPYYSARSSYSGIIDLAGFKKDRFYLYQAHWRPDLPMAHILPHWNWPDRVGQVTPVHVFTSGDEAELFLNGKSLGRKKKAAYEYRLRWDELTYTPGELKVVAYKNGKVWAEDVVKTTDVPAKLVASADRSNIKADGLDLSFIEVQVVDKNGLPVPQATNQIEFNVEGPGEIVATDNGDSSNMVAFGSKNRAAFSGKALVIVRGIKGKPGAIKISAQATGLGSTVVNLSSK